MSFYAYFIDRLVWIAVQGGKHEVLIAPNVGEDDHGVPDGDLAYQGGLDTPGGGNGSATACKQELKSGPKGFFVLPSLWGSWIAVKFIESFKFDFISETDAGFFLQFIE